MACPEALVLLLEAAASQPELAARLTPALLRASDVLATEACIAAQVVDLLERALPSLSPALARVAVAQQAGIGSGVKAPGTRLERMPPAAAQPWPHDQNFPPLHAIEGRQARLRYLGHPSTDAPGDWGVDSQAALVCYQIECGLPELGRWSAAVAAALDSESIGHMCMHRDDPATIFSAVSAEE